MTDANQSPTPQSNSPPAAFNVEERVAQYVQIRDMKKAIKERHEAELRPYNDALKLMESLLLGYLSETKQTAARTEAGTTHILDRPSATIEDGDAFRTFVIDNRYWHLVDWKANAPQVNEYQAAHDGMVPPGVKFTVFRTAGVRRS